MNRRQKKKFEKKLCCKKYGSKAIRCFIIPTGFHSYGIIIVMINNKTKLVDKFYMIPRYQSNSINVLMDDVHNIIVNKIKRRNISSDIIRIEYHENRYYDFLLKKPQEYKHFDYSEYIKRKEEQNEQTSTKEI